MIYALAATSLNLDPRLRRHGELRPRRVLRRRRLHGRHPDGRGRGERVDRAGRPRSLVAALLALAIGAICAAHARRVLHHDHARVRADDVLRVRLAEGLRRRRRPEPRRRARAVGLRPRPEGRRHVLLRRAGDPRRDAATACSAWCSARFGRVLAGDPRERDAHGGDRLPDLPLQAGLLRDRRRGAPGSPARCSPTRASFVSPQPARTGRSRAR